MLGFLKDLVLSFERDLSDPKVQAQLKQRWESNKMTRKEFERFMEETRNRARS